MILTQTNVVIDIADIIRTRGIKGALTILRAVLNPSSKTTKKRKTTKSKGSKTAPSFVVYLFNDNLHSDKYVTRMAKELGRNLPESFAMEVHRSGPGGKVVFFRGTRKECRIVRNRIASFGTDAEADQHLGKVGGSMKATVSRTAVN